MAGLRHRFRSKQGPPAVGVRRRAGRRRGVAIASSAASPVRSGRQRGRSWSAARVSRAFARPGQALAERTRGQIGSAATEPGLRTLSARRASLRSRGRTTAWETCSSSLALLADGLLDAAGEVLGCVGGANDGADRLVESSGRDRSAGGPCYPASSSDRSLANPRRCCCPLHRVRQNRTSDARQTEQLAVGPALKSPIIPPSPLPSWDRWTLPLHPWHSDH